MTTETRVIVRGVSIIKGKETFDYYDTFSEYEASDAMKYAEGLMFDDYKEGEGYDYVEIVEQQREYNPKEYDYNGYYGGEGEFITLNRPLYRVYNPEYEGE